MTLPIPSEVSTRFLSCFSVYIYIRSLLIFFVGSDMEKLVWFVFMMAISVVAVAQAAPPSEDCNSVLMDMFDCLSFVENGSTVPRPSTSCCNGFKKVLRNSPQCICEAFYNQNGSGLPIPIDMKKVMALPAACKATGPIPCISRICYLFLYLRDLLMVILIGFSFLLLICRSSYVEKNEGHILLYPSTR